MTWKALPPPNPSDFGNPWVVRDANDEVVAIIPRSINMPGAAEKTARQIAELGTHRDALKERLDLLEEIAAALVNAEDTHDARLRDRAMNRLYTYYEGYLEL